MSQLPNTSKSKVRNVQSHVIVHFRESETFLGVADVFPVVTSFSPKRNSEVKLKPKKPDALAGYTGWGRGRGRKEKL